MSWRFKANADNGDVEEDDDEGDENGVNKGNYKRNKNKRLLLGNCGYKSVKKVVSSPFNKLQKFYRRYSNTRSSSTTANSQSHKTAISRTRSGSYLCCLCVSKPQTLDTYVDGIDDPDDPIVSLKSLIEKNDFYCNESNTHFDV